MRMKLLQWMAAGCLLFGVIVPLAFTQGPGGPGGEGFGKGGFGKGGFGKGGGFGDPDFMFNMAAGKDKDGQQRTQIVIAEYSPRFGFEPVEKVREKMTAFLVSRGVNTGVMTKEHFNAYQEEQRAEMQKNFGGGKGGGFTFKMGGAGGGDTDGWAKSAFERMDKNKDGKISKEEAESGGGLFGRRSPLLDQWDTHDTNKDGYIDLAEYTEYTKNRFASRTGGKEGKGREEGKDGGKGGESKASTTPPKEPFTTTRPVVYRYGKLPTKELPSWFTELDSDKDGQVGLYEWRSAGKTTKDFKQYDVNADGFITAEEYIQVQRRLDAIAEPTTVTYLRVNAEPGTDSGVVAGSSSSTSSPGKGDKVGKGGKGGKMEWGGWGKGGKDGGGKGGKMEWGGWGKGKKRGGGE